MKSRKKKNLKKLKNENIDTMYLFSYNYEERTSYIT